MPAKPQDLVEQFIQSLGIDAGIRLQHLKVEHGFAMGERRFALDYLVRLKMPGGGVLDMAVEQLSAGYPRDVRLAMQTLRAYAQAQGLEGEATPLCVVANYLTPTSRKELTEAGINYFDSTGSMRFQHRSVLILKEIGEKPREERRPVRLFIGAREQVIHTLLHHGLRTKTSAFLSGSELAAEAAVSAYTVSQTMQELEREGWVETKGSGPAQRRRLLDPGRLLDAWAADWATRREKVSHWFTYSPRGHLVDHILSKFAEHSGWALTGAAAANAVAPTLTSVERVQVIVPPDCSGAWAKEMGFKRADKGSNVEFIERTGAALMFCSQHPDRPDSRFASPFIQYLDLLDGYGRNQELAHQYRSTVLQLKHTTT